MRTFILSIAAAFLVASSAASSALAIERCGGSRDCGSCGESDCQVVCEMKTVKKSCWVIECEQICPTLPACPRLSCDFFNFCGKKCSDGSCGEDAGCGNDCGKGCGSKKLVPPKCGKSRTIKKLVKKEYTCEVPVYKCTSCGACGPCGDGEEAAPPATPAKAPAVAKAPMPRNLGITYARTSR
jgi:hypothetical protein